MNDNMESLSPKHVKSLRRVCDDMAHGQTWQLQGHLAKLTREEFNLLSASLSEWWWAINEAKP